jgi:hypothetical protein
MKTSTNCRLGVATVAAGNFSSIRLRRCISRDDLLALRRELQQFLFARSPASAVDPQIGRGPDQVRPRVLELHVHLAEQAEDAHQGVLHQVLAIPDIAGETAAIAVQVRAQRRRLIPARWP